MLDSLQTILDTIDGVVWGPFVLMPLLLGTGILLTARLAGLQVTKLIPALRLALFERKDKDAPGGDVSQFQALTTALAATVGTGNIVGVATAISIGGPGALFWMWVTGVLGMASKYSEAFLGVRFRARDAKGEISGGPQYYLFRGIPNGFGKFLSLFFAIAAVLASFGIGNMTQGNSISANVESSFGVPVWITGLVLAVMTLLVLVGGIKSIGKVTSALVPVMILFYVLGALFILVVNIEAVPAAFATIFTSAFTGHAAVGGFTGSAIMVVVQMGVARGIFSNESGMGSAAIAAAAAQTTHPVRQGLVSMTQTFIDTIVVVTCTGLVIVTTGVWGAGRGFRGHHDRGRLQPRPPRGVGAPDRDPRARPVRVLHHPGLGLLRRAVHGAALRARLGDALPRVLLGRGVRGLQRAPGDRVVLRGPDERSHGHPQPCLLYTSDAADEVRRV